MLGTKVKVHWNLRRRCWSVLDGKTGRLLGHAPRLRLEGVTFKVSPAGRARTLRTGHRNVHAWAVGTVAEGADGLAPARQVGYNPYRAATFTDRATGEPVLSAAAAILLGDGRVACVEGP